MKVIVIMAGGTGERFWPLSRFTKPKQLLTLTGSGQSLLEEAVERSMAIVPPANIYIATSSHLQKAIQDAELGIPAENVIAEPCRRNTAGCLIYATATILARTNLSPEELTMGVLTADQRIPDTEPFVNTIGNAMDVAENNNALITVGIQPVRPETGYGYIEVAANAKSLGDDKAYPLFSVASFKEKPSADEAAKYIASGRFYWNSGMFFWRLSTFQNEFGHANPVMAETLEDLTDALMANDPDRAARIFDALPNISIDYALMEKAHNVMVVPGNFIWDDVGAWDALDRTFPRDNSGNVRVGDPVVIDCNDSIIYNARGQKKIAVGAVGLKDMVVVVDEDAVLVMPKNRAQDVRKVVISLRDRGATQL
ncbi:MAG: sugar phosphate nucleotidyltransferase [Lentisphaeria bacterium]|nr:sugar phosphate nucleotidyltransferase [Lentisphaeria bacterium]